MIQYVLLQLSKYQNGSLLEAALADLAAAVGGQTNFGLLVGSVIMLSFYVASNGGLATPATLTAISGGLLIGTLPPQFRPLAQVIIFLGLVAAVAAGLNKFVES